MQPHGRIVFGTVLMLVGLLLLLDTLRVLDFSVVMDSFWPLILVAVGIFMILKRRPMTAPGQSPGDVHAFGKVDSVSSADTIHHSVVFDNFSLKVTSPSFRGGDVSTIFGDTVLDLSECVLADGEQTLAIRGVFGACSLRLPKGTPYAVIAHSVFGSLKTPDQHREGISSTLSYDSPGYAVASKKLKMDISQVFGNIRLEE